MRCGVLLHDHDMTGDRQRVKSQNASCQLDAASVSVISGSLFVGCLSPSHSSHFNPIIQVIFRLHFVFAKGRRKLGVARIEAFEERPREIDPLVCIKPGVFRSTSKRFLSVWLQNFHGGFLSIETKDSCILRVRIGVVRSIREGQFGKACRVCGLHQPHCYTATGDAVFQWGTRLSVLFLVVGFIVPAVYVSVCNLLFWGSGTV